MSSGYDLNNAPNAVTGKRLLDAINGTFVAHYIGGPDQAETDWSPELLREYGRAGVKQVLPIYVGRQAEGPLTEAQGTADGLHAAQLLRSFGYHVHSYCALDIEYGTSERNRAGALQYCDGWCWALNHSGYWPGPYASAPFINDLQAAHSGASFIWLANWIRSGYDPSLTNHAESDWGIIAAGAWPRHRIWQYATGQIDGWDVDFDIANFPLNPTPT